MLHLQYLICKHPELFRLNDICPLAALPYVLQLEGDDSKQEHNEQNDVLNKDEQ